MKIAVSGAGVAGPAVAYWLQRQGHDVLLIEKAPRLRSGGYIVDFWGVGFAVAERMGVIDRIMEAGYAVERVRLVDRRGREVAGFSSEAWRRITGNRFTSILRSDLARSIYDQVGGRIETAFGDTITAIEDNGSAVSLQLEKHGRRDFDLLIGADGLHSNVRRLVFGDESRFERRLGHYVAAFEAQGYAPRSENVYVTYGIAGRQVARFALRGGGTMFLFVFAQDRLDGPEPRQNSEYKAALDRIFGDIGWECPQILKAMRQSGEIYFDRVSQIRMDAWSKGRVALIGDAAACASLLAGEGTGLALTEAYVLAGELGAAKGDYPVAFRRYEERLRPFIEGKQKSARDFAPSFAPRTTAGVWWRNHVLKLMGIPAVARLFLGRSLRDDFELPTYAALDDGNPAARRA